jgi:diguanylate cyclase (GGDEF)-like protein
MRVLNDTIRPTDFLARYGGEEFAIILHATDAEGGAMAAERCRAAIDKESWPHRKVTASLGVSTFASGTSVEELIDAADAALYTAKLAGRNCVRSAGK